MQTHTAPLIHRLAFARLKASTRNALVALELLIASVQISSAAVTVRATNDDRVSAAPKDNPGDQVADTIQINNTRTADATGVQLLDSPVAGTTAVAGTLNVTLVAIDETYPQTALANMNVNTATSGFRFGLLG